MVAVAADPRLSSTSDVGERMAHVASEQISGRSPAEKLRTGDAARRQYHLPSVRAGDSIGKYAATFSPNFLPRQPLDSQQNQPYGIGERALDWNHWKLARNIQFTPKISRDESDLQSEKTAQGPP